MGGFNQFDLKFLGESAGYERLAAAGKNLTTQQNPELFLRTGNVFILV
ncbi:20244_t:CDS:2 [Cetraspora pellucida]|uniref:20244_t:CDS:1 n=1 Tax=Cetraspora pellucida TaxID=1433469 RepID=A0A9N9G2D2_9GLOM|nr:20244_t:CDS:2 [Cetraspora pellucida]